MANEQNLRPCEYKLSQEEAKKGGKRSAEVRKARKTLREELLMLLAEGDTQNKMSVAQIVKALNGDTRAFEVIRDTIGEKPTDKVEQSGDSKLTIKLEGDSKEWAN